jgi:hypothetical protein
MSFRLSWDLLNLLPAPGKSISHVRLVQLLEGEHRGDELPESFARKVLNHLHNLAYILEPKMSLVKIDRIYYCSWAESASSLPIVRNNAPASRRGSDTWVGQPFEQMPPDCLQVSRHEHHCVL